MPTTPLSPLSPTSAAPVKTDWLDGGVSDLLSRRGSQAGRYGAMNLAVKSSRPTPPRLNLPTPIAPRPAAPPPTPSPAGATSGAVETGGTMADPYRTPRSVLTGVQHGMGLGSLGSSLNNIRNIAQTGLAGATKVPGLGAALTAGTATLDAIRTPLDLVSGKDSLNQMHFRDMERMNNPAYGNGALGKFLGYNDAVSMNTLRPVASSLALGDAALDTGLRAPANVMRQWGLNRGLAEQDARHSAETQQAMQTGSASRGQLIDQMARARAERAASQPSALNPIYWGMGG